MNSAAQAGAPAQCSKTAEEITRRSKSNLALAFVCLPKARRRDMSVFYAFCRIVDDIADSAELSVAEKRAQLGAWRRIVVESGASGVAGEVQALIAKYKLPAALFHEIIEGVEMDLSISRYETFEDLRKYCYRVASAVGLVSIEIFGYTNPRCKEYAVDLGLALQLTNILRDVGQDLNNGGRVYLPLEDFARFGYSIEDLAARRHNDAFLQLMRFEADRAETFYQRAIAALPPEDRRSMMAAEIMRGVYWRVLQRMRAGDFRVFERRYRLTALEKMWTIVSTIARSFVARERPRPHH